MRRKGEQNTSGEGYLKFCQLLKIHSTIDKYSGLNLNQDKAASRRQYK